MKKNHISQSGVFNPRVLVAFSLCSAGVLLAMLSFAADPPNGVRGPGASSPGNALSADRHAGPLNGNPAAAMPGQPSDPSGPGWSLVTSPDTNITGGLNGVTCVSASDCWAVGSYTNGSGTPQTLIEQSNGGAWLIVTSPNNGTGDNYLSGVTCASATECFAVGAYYNNGSNIAQTLIEQWNGTSWAIVSSPNNGTSINQLNSVTCVSATECFAVGYYENSGDFDYQTLIEQWNGSSWSIVTSPNNNGNGLLQGVTCASASDCWAVGYYYNGGVGQTLIEQWNGTSWSIVPSPNYGTNANYLYGVTCVSQSQCFAVGYILDETDVLVTLIEQWNGTSWSIATAGIGPPVFGVTCVSASECFAVGYKISGGNYDQYDQTLIEQWNGTSWSIVTSPNNGTGQANELYGVTCVSASECFAVGAYYDGTLIEQWNGASWSIPTFYPGLNSVTCASASDCWAVGYYYNGGYDLTLIEQWNGTSWSIVPSPNNGTGGDNELNGVTCVSASECFAIGAYVNSGGYYQTLIEQWNGTSWSIVTSPNTSATDYDVLSSVTCASTTECFAVGFYINGSGVGQTLIEQWNGTSWSIVSSPSPSASSNSLYGVTCASASECWAVGNYNNGGVGQTLIERWNGTSWSLVTSPNNGTAGSALYGVTCASASECWAVGYYYNGSVNQTLIEQWNGTSWSLFTSAVSSTTENNYLYGVTCASATECWAVGYYYNGSVNQTLIEQSNGSSWPIVTSPNSSAVEDNELQGVACASASDCWAVGQYDTGTQDAQGNEIYQALIEEYSPTMPPLTSVVSELVHGSAGAFDINLPLTGNPGIECRSSASQGAGNYTMIFNLVNNVASVASASVTSGTGSVSGTPSIGPNPNQYTVNLTGVSDQQYLTVTLNDVTDSEGNTGTVSATMGVLIGNVTFSGRVSSADVSQVRQQTLEPITTSNFQDDINCSGRIDSSDVSIARQQTLTSLP